MQNIPTLRELNLKQSYDTGNIQTDVVADFLQPLFQVADKYDRLAGFFSSSMLATAARGLGSFISRGGKMRIVASPKLNESDISGLERSDELEVRKLIFERALEREFNREHFIANSIIADHVAAMAWMLDTGALELRIAVPSYGEQQSALFHPKVGVVTDSTDSAQLSFSGSINETATAWSSNAESFKVFREWVDSEKIYFDTDHDLFESYWQGDEYGRFETLRLSDALRNRILESAPMEFDPKMLTKPSELRSRATKIEKDRPQLRNYQLDAISAWEESGHKGILAMATGTGKTKTALGCYDRIRTKFSKMVTIVTSPYQHIAVQWAKEFENYRPLNLAGNSHWRRDLGLAIDECRLGLRSHLVITVVQDTAANEWFIDQVTRSKASGFKLLIIGDECHGLGATKMRQVLTEDFDFRLGLSATPQRYFDEVGTQLLEDFFGGDVFTFDIKKALAWRDPITGGRALCDYEYFPIPVSLSPKEEEDYASLTEQLIVAYNVQEQSPSIGAEARIEKLLRDRAMIRKKAIAKIPALDALLQNLGNTDHSIVYCVDSTQLEAAMEILQIRKLTVRRFTGQEGTSPDPTRGGLSERETILSLLASGDIDALVAMKCLDEGVDVPSARTAFILASSGNPREFVQRRGRILRPDTPGKIARIYDFVVVPSRSKIVSEDATLLVVGQFESELRRMEEFAMNAINRLQAHSNIVTMKP